MKRFRPERIVFAHPFHDRDAITVGSNGIGRRSAAFRRQMIQRQKPFAGTRMFRVERQFEKIVERLLPSGKLGA